VVTDVSIDPEGGIATWKTGFNRLVDLAVVLHHRSKLELDTVNDAFKACFKCWSVTTTHLARHGRVCSEKNQSLTITIQSKPLKNTSTYREYIF
jgi:hypothetical protein